MIIKSAEFIQSVPNADMCPPPNYPEYAFVGRSNVGKSSLINMLTDHKGLAKTSSTPGKTQLINHFLINGNWYLVDLPGYGYARTNKQTKHGFKSMISGYITTRPNLMCIFVLIDCRHPLQKADDAFITWLGENEVPFKIIFTKMDKVSNPALQKNIAGIFRSLKEKWEELPGHYITSSEQKKGRDEILGFIEQTNKKFDY